MSEPTSKREYHPPTVFRIELQAEEVLAVGCKMQGPANSNNAGMSKPCSVAPCSTIGS